MNDPFRPFHRWPLRHKLASFCGAIVGGIIGFILLVAVWLVTFWQWFWGQ